MSTLRITKTVVEQTKPQAKDLVVHDSELRGFHLKVTPKGKRVFFVYYRAKGARVQQRRYKIGDYPKISVNRARELAKGVLGRVAGGEDPSAQLKATRHSLNTDQVDEIAERFLVAHVSKNRSANETRRIFRHNVLPVIGKRSIHDLTRADISKLIANVARTAPTMANRVLAAVRKFFNWCYSNSIIEKSPAEGIGAPSREVQRDRLLSDDEVLAVVTAARDIGYPYGAIVELLVITGQRRKEVAAATWPEFDLGQRTWTIPASRSKNGKAHIVHLSDAALLVLARCPNTGTLVFSVNGKTPFQGFSKSKARLDQRSGVSEWRLHDLRRTVVSGMARMGIAPHIADKVLNHQAGTISGTAAVYQRHQFLDERKDALDRWAVYVEKLVQSKQQEVGRDVTPQQ